MLPGSFSNHTGSAKANVALPTTNSYCPFCCNLGDHTYSIGILVVDCFAENNFLQDTIYSRNTKHPNGNKITVTIDLFLKKSGKTHHS